MLMFDYAKKTRVSPDSDSQFQFDIYAENSSWGRQKKRYTCHFFNDGQLEIIDRYNKNKIIKGKSAHGMVDGFVSSFDSWMKGLSFLKNQRLPSCFLTYAWGRSGNEGEKHAAKKRLDQLYARPLEKKCKQFYYDKKDNAGVTEQKKIEAWIEKSAQESDVIVVMLTKGYIKKLERGEFKDKQGQIRHHIVEYERRLINERYMHKTILVNFSNNIEPKDISKYFPNYGGNMILNFRKEGHVGDHLICLAEKMKEVSRPAITSTLSSQKR